MRTNYYFTEEIANWTFAGRERELEWLDSKLLNRSENKSILITGAAGIGKTTLIKYWLSSRKMRNHPIWVDAPIDSNISFNDFIEYLSSVNSENYPEKDGLLVVVNGTDSWDAEQHEQASRRIFNFKMVRSLIFTRRESM